MLDRMIDWLPHWVGWVAVPIVLIGVAIMWLVVAAVILVVLGFFLEAFIVHPLTWF